jgi:hypothetical protein
MQEVSGSIPLSSTRLPVERRDHFPLQSGVVLNRTCKGAGTTRPFETHSPGLLGLNRCPPDLIRVGV